MKKCQWLAVGLVLLGVGIQSPQAIANGISVPAVTPSPFQFGDTTVSQSQLEGFWYSQLTCQEGDPESSAQHAHFEAQGTSEYRSNQQYSDRVYFEVTAVINEQTVTFSGRTTMAGTYSLDNNILEQTIQDINTSYNAVLLNGQPAPSEISQLMEQWFDELMTTAQIASSTELELKPTPDGKLEFGELVAAGCNMSPAYKVEEALF